MSRLLDVYCHPVCCHPAYLTYMHQGLFVRNRSTGSLCFCEQRSDLLPQQPLGTAPLRLRLLLPHANPFGSVAIFSHSGPCMVSLLTCSVDVRILDLASSAHSESATSLGAYTPCPSPQGSLAGD